LLLKLEKGKGLCLDYSPALLQWSAKTFRHFPENKELMETSSDSFGCKNFQVIHLAEKLTVMLTFFLSFFL
jgi:hypothetical protein